MKTPYTWIIIVGILCLYACKKDIGAAPLATQSTSTTSSNLSISSNLGGIIGKWNIVADSTYAGVGVNNHPVNYAGKTGDYFDIRNNDTIYTKEGAVLDTLAYIYPRTDTAIVISFFGPNINGVQSASHFRLSANALTIASPVLLSPGGVFARKISLSR